MRVDGDLEHRTRRSGGMHEFITEHPDREFLLCCADMLAQMVEHFATEESKHWTMTQP